MREQPRYKFGFGTQPKKATNILSPKSWNGPASWRKAKLAKRQPVKFRSPSRALWKSQQKAASRRRLRRWRMHHDLVSSFSLLTSHFPPVSLTEILAEIPKLSFEERQELVRR